MKTLIQRCYDSHTHLLATGQMLATLHLKGLRKPSDLSQLSLEPSFFRGDWLIGFGWDQHLFPEGKFPTRFDLDYLFPDKPVAFSRVDGHALWVNSRALQICELLKPVKDWKLPPGAQAFEDSKGSPTGILIDRAMELIFAKIPPESFSDKKSFLLGAVKKFNRAGFTHIRDMSGNKEQWDALRALENANDLTAYLDQNFSFERPEDFKSALQLCEETAAEGSKKIKVRGVKFYLDGALGSEGAALSQNYSGSESRGLLLWSHEQMKDWIQQTWSKKFEVSIHALGDQAAENVARAATEVWQSGQRGILNIEHAEVMRTETVAAFQKMHVNVHMQPCHWLSDREWLKNKLGNLSQFGFPWHEVSKAGMKLSWGSDSPIEEPDLLSNRRALSLSAESGILPYENSWWKPHEHPLPSWGENCVTEIEDDQIISVTFDGEPLF